MKLYLFFVILLSLFSLAISVKHLKTNEQTVKAALSFANKNKDQKKRLKIS